MRGADLLRIALANATTCVLATVAAAAPPSIDLREPLEYSDFYPLTSNHLHAAPRSAWNLDADAVRVRARFGWSNTYIREDDYRIDVETFGGPLEVEWGASPDFALRAALPVVWQGGGRLDHLIDDWHDFWSLPSGKRRRSRRNDFVATGQLEDGRAFELTETGFGIGSPSLGARWQLARGEGAATAMDAEVSLPTPADQYGHQGVDAALGLVHGRRLGAFEYGGGIEAIGYSDTEQRRIEYSALSLEGFLHAAYALTDRFAIVLQARAAWPTVTNIVGHPEYATYIDGGVRFRISSSLALEVAVRENPAPDNGTSDFGVLFGASGVWGRETKDN